MHEHGTVTAPPGLIEPVSVPEGPSGGDHSPRTARPGRWQLAAIGVLAVAVVVLPHLPAPVGPRATMALLAFVALVVESLPFLLGGAMVAALLQRLPADWVTRVSTRHPRLATALAPAAGLALPLCDCGLVPLARRLHADGARASMVGAFVAGAPLTSPIVILSTLVAFPGRPGMVVGRVAVGVAVAWIVAVVAPRPDPEVTARQAHAHCDHRPTVLGATWTEFSRTAPTLVVGALLAGTLKAVIPSEVLVAISSQPLLGAAAMMLLAFVLAICSQADAFVAASLPVGPLPQLAFLTLGPALDVRLAALYRREFGTGWVVRYAATVVPAVLVLVTLWVTWGAS